MEKSYCDYKSFVVETNLDFSASPLFEIMQLGDTSDIVS
jgi:hypothetical protein